MFERVLCPSHCEMGPICLWIMWAAFVGGNLYGAKVSLIFLYERLTRRTQNPSSSFLPSPPPPPRTPSAPAPPRIPSPSVMRMRLSWLYLPQIWWGELGPTRVAPFPHPCRCPLLPFPRRWTPLPLLYSHSSHGGSSGRGSDAALTAVAPWGQSRASTAVLDSARSWQHGYSSCGFGRGLVGSQGFGGAARVRVATPACRGLTHQTWCCRAVGGAATKVS